MIANDQSSLNTQSDAETKSKLEIEKLQAENTNIRSRFWVPAVIQAIPATCAVFITLGVAWYTGLIDAKRTLLQIEEKEIRKEVADLKNQLNESRSKLDEFTAEEKAVRDIRKWFPNSEIALIADAYDISIAGTLPWDKLATRSSPGSRIIIPKSLSQPVNSAYTSNAIKSLAAIRSVRTLSILDITLTAEDLAELRHVKWMPKLHLKNNSLDDISIKSLPERKGLTSLTLTNQRFTELPDLGAYRGLETLLIEGTTVIPHRSLKCLLNSRKLKILSIPISITDDDVAMLLEIPELQWLHVMAESLSERGALELANQSKLVMLHAEKFKGNKEAVTAAIKSREEGGHFEAE